MPTVSVLLGDCHARSQLFDEALAGAGQTVVWSDQRDLPGMAGQWLRELEARRELEAEAFGVLAAALGQSVAELRASWAARSPRERRLWLGQCDVRGAAAVSALDALRVGSETHLESGDAAVRLSALMAWLPRPECLGVRVEASNSGGLRALLALAVDSPAISLLASVEAAVWAALRPQLDDRSLTLLEQGIIALPRMAADGGSAADSATPPSDVRERLAEAIAQARVAHQKRASNAEELSSRARSLAEQRLHELLQADPITRDLFVLNLRLPFTFGPAQAEVDLACAELRLAVEVDGYHHFQASDAYRRDRRKDVLLQHQGYLVSRHLATDVMERSSEVVRAIRELVKRRRRSRRRQRAT